VAQLDRRVIVGLDIQVCARCAGLHDRKAAGADMSLHATMLTRLAKAPIRRRADPPQSKSTGTLRSLGCSFALLRAAESEPPESRPDQLI
jgi:hypothetical protein